MNERLDSYKISWSSPVCQREIKDGLYLENRSFLFSNEEAEVPIPFLLDESLEKLPISFVGRKSTIVKMGINGPESLPLNFLVGEQELEINFSIKVEE